MWVKVYAENQLVATELSCYKQNPTDTAQLQMKDDIQPYKFQPGQSGNPNGRPLKIHTILKASGYTLDDIREAFKEIGWNDIDKMEEIVEDRKQPLIIKVVARAFIKASEKGDFRYISEILSHVIGKPKETVEATITKKSYKITLNINKSDRPD